MMKNGYHGGLTRQEMVVPIVVLSSSDKFPAGWREQPVDTPAWWDDPVRVETLVVQPKPVLKPAKPKARNTLRPPWRRGRQHEEPKEGWAKTEEGRGAVPGLGAPAPGLRCLRAAKATQQAGPAGR